MERENIYNDPGEKEEVNTKTGEEQQDEMEEGVYLYNDDGTPMDTSERTYVSVDLPEDEPSKEDEDEDE